MSRDARTSKTQLPLTDRLSADPGIDPFLRRDTVVEIMHLKRKLREAESAEIDFKNEIKRLRAEFDDYKSEASGQYESLDRDNERLRAALERIAMGSACDDPACTSMFHEGCDAVTDKDKRYKAIARRALRMDEAAPADETTAEQR